MFLFYDNKHVPPNRSDISLSTSVQHFYDSWKIDIMKWNKAFMKKAPLISKC